MKKLRRKIAVLLLLFFSFLPIYAQETGFPNDGGTTAQNVKRQTQQPFIQFNIRRPGSNQDVAFSVQVLLLITLISLAPSLLILCTCFLRISIVLDFENGHSPCSKFLLRKY